MIKVRYLWGMTQCTTTLRGIGVLTRHVEILILRAVPNAQRVFSGERLLKMRKSRGLSRMALARLIPIIGPMTIMRYELEGGTPDANRLLELARALKCEPEDFFDAAR